jgi:uncharacterized paraquat-inducible protein A
MVPDARTILRRRSAVLLALRLLAVIIPAIGVVVLGIHLTHLTQSNIGFDMWEYRGAVMAAVVVFGLPSLALALASACLARWIVAAPEQLSGCPGCGYTVASLDRGVCPECGLNLGPPNESPVSPSGSARAAKDHA